MNKYALLIGINYINTSMKLDGAINDVKNIENLIRNKFGYQNIKLINDHSKRKPTKKVILEELNKIINEINCGNCDEFWFHYSGHGSNIPDYSGDEIDGRDEILIPIDYHKGNIISDDELYEILRKIKNKNCKIFCLIDCCHSGTQFDLPYLFTKRNKVILNNNTDLECKVTLISGCSDKEVSYDVFNANGQNKASGAMTSSLISSLKALKFHCSFFDLIQHMYNFLKKKQYDQSPQLSSNYDINDGTMFCSKLNGKLCLM